MKGTLSAWLFRSRMSARVLSSCAATVTTGITPLTSRTSLCITVREAVVAASTSGGRGSSGKKKVLQRLNKEAVGRRYNADSSVKEKKHSTRVKNSSPKRTAQLAKMMEAGEDEGDGGNIPSMIVAGDMVDEDLNPWEGNGKYEVIDSDHLDGDENSTISQRRSLTTGCRTVNKTGLGEGGEEDVYDDNWGTNDNDGVGADGSGSMAANDMVPLLDDQSRYLKNRFPDLAAEYDTEANQEPLDEVLQDSARVASWKCVDCGFTWKSGIFVRTCLRTKCPRCELKRNPRLESRFIPLWEYSLNDPCVDPKTLAASSNKSVYWRCPNCSTSYQARIKDMVTGKAKCPSCPLLDRNPDFDKDENILLQEWHPLKNGDLQPSQVRSTDRTKVWWLCMACGHEWEATLAARLNRSSRAKGKECPVCNRKKK